MDAAPAREKDGLASYTIVTHDTWTLAEGSMRNFVITRMLRSLRVENDYYKLIDPSAYWQNYNHYIVNTLMNNARSKIRFAILTDDPDVILGFAMYRDSILDYVYVQREQRLLGIGTRLLPNGIRTITHLTNACVRILGINYDKYGHWKFNPFA